MSAPGAESYLGEDDVADIRAVQADGFATRLELADPAVFVHVYRDGSAVGDPVHVLVVPANRQSRETTDGGALSVALDGGMLRAWAPWDIDRGDLVKIGSATAVIRSTPPVRNGIQDAIYEIQDGGGTDG